MQASQFGRKVKKSKHEGFHEIWNNFGLTLRCDHKINGINPSFVSQLVDFWGQLGEFRQMSP